MKTEIKNLEKKKWPKRIFELPKSHIPKKLRIKGIQPDWNQKRICIIGSRNFSEYGDAVCKKIIEELSGYEITVVSGLAYGIDSLAHKYALENGLMTIAIPGSGLEDSVIYPKRHFNLSNKIIENGGCLISEYDDNQEAAPWTFPQRNRIMAAISDLVLIIEAEEKSGTMITARFALEYNIDVACIPGSIFNQNSKGTNKLLSEGAYLVSSGKDIIDILGLDSVVGSGDLKINRLKNILKEDELKVFNLLKNPLTKDELLDKSLIEINRLNQILSVLEINDLVKFLENKICQK